MANRPRSRSPWVILDHSNYSKKIDEFNLLACLCSSPELVINQDDRAAGGVNVSPPNARWLEFYKRNILPFNNLRQQNVNINPSQDLIALSYNYEDIVFMRWFILKGEHPWHSSVFIPR